MPTKTKANPSDTKLKKVLTLLVSQPEPSSQALVAYTDLEKKYGIRVDFRPFIHVESIPEKEFRKNRIRLDEHRFIIFNSKFGIDNFFRLAEEMRGKISPDTRYFCLTEAVANYLQKFILYRKRKVFIGEKAMSDLQHNFTKYKAETFLVPMSNLGNKVVTQWLDDNKLKYLEAEMYRTVSSDLSDLADIKYDMLAFFSPQGLQSVFDNFPDFVQEETRIACFGSTTCKAAEDLGLRVDIRAPQPDAPSMTGAIAKYLTESNK
jgi:uroporphyrinogen-III synthase